MPQVQGRPGSQVAGPQPNAGSSMGGPMGTFPGGMPSFGGGMGHMGGFGGGMSQGQGFGSGTTGQGGGFGGFGQMQGGGIGQGGGVWPNGYGMLGQGFGQPSGATPNQEHQGPALDGNGFPVRQPQPVAQTGDQGQYGPGNAAQGNNQVGNQPGLLGAMPLQHPMGAPSGVMGIRPTGMMPLNPASQPNTVMRLNPGTMGRPMKRGY